MTTYKHTSAKALPILIYNYKIYNTTDKIFKEQKSETPIFSAYSFPFSQFTIRYVIF